MTDHLPPEIAELLGGEILVVADLAIADVRRVLDVVARRLRVIRPAAAPSGAVTDAMAIAACEVFAPGIAIGDRRCIEMTKDAIRAALAAASPAEAGGWIKCSERMPPIGERVLVDGYSRQHGHPTACYIEAPINRWEQGPGLDCYWSTHAGPMSLDCVHHWMPLPAPAQAGEGE